MNENQRTVFSTASYEKMEVDDELYGQPLPWSQLPPHVIENIYSYLNRKDQKSTSLVCRNWRKEYCFPTLWRRFKLCLPSLEYYAEMFDVNLARRYGAMFHHLEIVFGLKIRRRQLDGILRQLKLFLEVVAASSQLLSISFSNINFYLHRLDDEVSEEVCQAVVNCLKSQNKLQYVNISNSQFRKSAAEEILNVLLLNNSKTLKYLFLTGFVDELFDVESTESTHIDQHSNFLTLMNLIIWKTNYCQIFEKMILSFYEYRNSVDLRGQKGYLKEIELFCDGDITDNHSKIHPDVWKYFRRIFPDLRINMTFQSESEPANIDSVIVPYMPLKALDFEWENIFNNESVLEIGSLLRHIVACEIHKSLEVLRINWRNNSLNLVPDLISFTNVCPELKILELYIQHPVDALDNLFDSWLESRPASLDVVQITIEFVQTMEEKMYYADLRDFYAALLKSLDLSLILLVN